MTLDPSDSAVATEPTDSTDVGPIDPGGSIENHADRLLDAFLEQETLDDGLCDAVDRLRENGHLWDALELVVVSEKEPEAARRLLDAAVIDA